MRIVVLSFDDGTIYDKGFIELLDKYHLSATLNLNSGLDDYVWYYEDKFKIERLTLKDNVELYKNHEVASHTFKHQMLTELSKDEIIYEVNEDIKRLSKTFNRKIESFAIPFDQYTEEIVQIIKNNCPVSNIRVSEFADRPVPLDRYHIGINALYDDVDIYEKLERFSKNTYSNSLFVIAGHAYEFEVKNDWGKIEALLKYLADNKDIKVMTMKDAVKVLFD